MLSWVIFRHGPTDPEAQESYIAHGDELVKVLAHLKRQADGEAGKPAQPLSDMKPQDLVPFLERFEVVLNAFGNMEKMTDPEGVE